MPHSTNKCLISFGSLFKLTAVVQKSPKVSIGVCILKQSSGLKVFCGWEVVSFHFDLQRNRSTALCPKYALFKYKNILTASEPIRTENGSGSWSPIHGEDLYQPPGPGREFGKQDLIKAA